MADASVSLLEERFARPWLLLLAGVVPLLLLFDAWVRRRRQRGLLQLLGMNPLASLHAARSGGGTWLRATAVLLVVLGCAGPQWGRDPELPPSQGRDLMIVLDVSQSMLAEDPRAGAELESRLRRAHRYLRDLSRVMQQRGGSRIGLIIFAGEAHVLCPPTDDYRLFRALLAEADPRRLGQAGRLGSEVHGTHFRKAIETAVRHQDERFRGYREIMLVSDGEDLAQDWESAVKLANAAGIPVHTLAVGNTDRGYPIPQPGGGHLPSKDDPTQPQLTSRVDATLQAIAKATGGTFQGEEASARPLVQWYQSNVAALPSREWTGDGRPQPAQQFFWFFAGALALLACEIVLGEGPARRPGD